MYYHIHYIALRASRREEKKKKEEKNNKLTVSWESKLILKYNNLRIFTQLLQYKTPPPHNFRTSRIGDRVARRDPRDSLSSGIFLHTSIFASNCHASSTEMYRTFNVHAEMLGDAASDATTCESLTNYTYPLCGIKIRDRTSYIVHLAPIDTTYQSNNNKFHIVEIQKEWELERVSNIFKEIAGRRFGSKS